MAYRSEKLTKMAIICTKTTISYDEYQQELQKFPQVLDLYMYILCILDCWSGILFIKLLYMYH